MRKLSQRVFGKDDATKEQCQIWHCMKRIRQRLGIKLTEQQYSHVVSCIKNSKQSDLCRVKYLYDQSKRLTVYELIFEGYEPVNVIYDRFRKTIVTVLFPTDGIEITHYIDVFNNKINIKHDLGYNRYWRYNNNELVIPMETVVKNNDIYEIVSDGIVKNKKFKFEHDELYEVM